MSIAEKLTTIAENQQAVYDAGKQAEADRFWDSYLVPNGRYLFAGYGWNNDSFQPSKSFTVTNAYSMFMDSGITDIVTPLKEKGVFITFDTTELIYTFRWMNIEEIDNVIFARPIVRPDYFVANCPKLKRIVPVIPLADGAYVNNSMFNNCPALEDVRFSGVISRSIDFPHSSALSDGTVENVLGCLADLTGQTAQTLTLHADVGARLTEAQKEAIAAKNWTLVY